MYRFRYHRATNVNEAIDLWSNADSPTFLAGGMTLIPSLKMRLAAHSDVIDLGAIDSLSGIVDHGDKVSIGAMTTHSSVAGSSAIPSLADLAGNIGDVQVRNRGTIGGSVANSDPAADYPAAIVGLGATIHTPTRPISGDEYFKNVFETALDEGELITSVSFPKPSRAAYVKFENPASRYAIVGVFVACFGSQVRVGITGAGPCAFRLTAFEDALSADFSTVAIADHSIDAAGFNDDIHASASYRAHLVAACTKRAVASLGA